MTDEYETPILATIFRFLGAINLLVAAFALIGGISEAERTRMAWLSLVPFFAALGSALICFGVGQVIDYIGQIAFYSRLIYEQVERGETLTPDRFKDVQRALKRIADNTRRDAAPAAPPAQSPPAESAARPPSANLLMDSRYYYVDSNAQTVGPLAASELLRLADSGVLKPESLICREGGDEWRKAIELLEFPA